MCLSGTKNTDLTITVPFKMMSRSTPTSHVSLPLWPVKTLHKTCCMATEPTDRQLREQIRASAKLAIVNDPLPGTR